MRFLAVRVARPVVVALLLLSCTPDRAIGPTVPLAVRPLVSLGSTSVVISQVYGGGGNNGGVFKHDFIELFNRGTEEISLEGWSVQYISQAGPTTTQPSWSKTNLSGSIAPGQYRLIQEAAGASLTQPLLPSPDIVTATGSAAGAPIAMSATAGKVALVRNTTALTCGSATNACSPEVRGTIADLVGYGTGTTFFEGAGPTGTLANATAAIRLAAGCTDTDENASDFNVATPTPRNGQTARITCDVTPPPPPPPPGLPATRFVELHYDNLGSDVNEALEIEGPAGFSVAGWSVVLYNGNGGATYDTRSLNGTIPDMCDGRGVIALRFEPDGIQNGPPDGFALVDAAGQVVEFLSYEGTFAATNGPAATRTSVNIGVSELSDTPLGHSIRRDATGTWQPPAAGNSIGACNSGVGPAMPAYQNISFTGRTPNDIALPVGFQDQIFASVIDEKGDAVTTSITWLAETPGIATLDSRQVITALGAGTSQFRATTAQGFTRVLSLPTHVATASTTALYGNNAEFGEPADGDAGDDFILRRAQLTLSYNRNRGTPNWVSYNLEATHIGTLDRCDCFTFDPALPADFPRYNTADYTGVAAINGYSIDRGHLARSFDRTTGTLDNAFTFYFSNIVPQASDINQGPWADMETFLGNLARNSNKEVYIITGVAGEKGTVKNEGKITIPAKVWKVAVIMPRDKGLADVHNYQDLEVISVIMPNDPLPDNPGPLANWETYKTTVDEVEQLSGYDLLDKLDDQTEILVESGDKPPTAEWGGETSGFEGSPVDFDASRSSDPDVGDVLTYSWDFGDGKEGTGVNPAHVFADNGVYTVVLSVKDRAGAVDTESNFVTIGNVAPSVVITTPPTIYSGQTYSFSGGFGDLGQDDDPWRYQIAWGNGSSPIISTSSQGAITGSRQYFTAGNYNIGLTVTDKDGGSGSASATLRVLRLPTGMNVNPSVINTSGGGNGQVIVTIFGNSEFDGSMIRLSSIRIGSAAPDTRGNSDAKATVTDANGDGILDLVVRFTRSDLIDAASLNPTTTELTLRADLTDNRQIEARGGVDVRSGVAR